MIFIAAKFTVKPDFADQWIDLVHDFTEATRAEPGNLWFEWSRCVESPDQYVLLEAFKEDAAQTHVSSDHFTKATAELPQYLQETPQVRNTVMEGDHWDRLGEMTVA